MSMRLKFVLVGLGCVAVGAMWFMFIFRPNQTKITELRDDVETTKQEVVALEAQLRRLQQLQREEPRLRADLARFSDALPADPRIPDFILQVQDAANAAGIDFLTITPSLPTAAAVATSSAPATGTSGATGAATATPAPTNPGGPAPAQAAAPSSGLKEIAVSLSTTGAFFEIEDFINRLEHLARAVKIDDFTLSVADAQAGGGLSVTMKIHVFTASAPTAPTSPATAGPATTTGSA